MAKTLVIYYSRKGKNMVNGSVKKLEKGNTEVVAEYINDVVGAELFQIDTVKPYSNSYLICTAQAKKELSMKERPTLKWELLDISAYDNIVIAGPCWWGSYPMAIFTQIDKLDFKGKKVFAVMTHEGSGLGNVEHDLKKSCKGATLGKGLAVHGGSVGTLRNMVENWAKMNLV